MKVINNIEEFNRFRNGIQVHSIGFIPTMGALHTGHMSLIKQSINDSECTIVSIFVNPTQFDKAEDLKNYPNLLSNDINKLELAGVDCLFLPSYEEVYPDNYSFSVTENKLSKLYCGAHRSGHFDGVLTIVMKLFNLVKPNKAYFGQKDFQQLTLIRRMVSAFFMPVEIMAGPTIREKDGLAMSSRNLNLSKQDREIAPKLYQVIQSNLSLNQMKIHLQKHGFKVEYLEELDGYLLVAAYLGKIRLIDNIKIKQQELTV